MLGFTSEVSGFPCSRKLSIQGSVQPPKPPAHPPSRDGQLWATPVLSSAPSPEPHRRWGHPLPSAPAPTGTLHTPRCSPGPRENLAPTSLHTLCAPFTWSVRAHETHSIGHRLKQPSPHSAGGWESKVKELVRSVPSENLTCAGRYHRLAAPVTASSREGERGREKEVPSPCEHESHHGAPLSSKPHHF